MFSPSIYVLVANIVTVCLEAFAELEKEHLVYSSISSAPKNSIVFSLSKVDLKPANVRISSFDGPRQRVKLGDLGLGTQQTFSYGTGPLSISSLPSRTMCLAHICVAGSWGSFTTGVHLTFVPSLSGHCLNSSSFTHPQVYWRYHCSHIVAKASINFRTHANKDLLSALPQVLDRNDGTIRFE